MFIAHYPQDVHQFDDLERLIEEYLLQDYIPDGPIIDVGSTIRAQGSCFAGNIAKALSQRKLNVRHMDIQEAVNSPHANKLMYEHIIDPSKRYAFPQHEKLFPTELLDKVRNLISTETVFILTLGLAATWFPRDGAIPIFEPDPKNLNAFDFRFEGVDENVQYIHSIVDAVRSLNPTINVVLTLSPVPLKATVGERKSAIVGDLLSKATLRLAVERYLDQAPARVYYWPAFEVVRWLGAHLPPVFGAEDGKTRHVNQRIIDLIIDLFLKHFATEAARSPK